MSNTSSTDIAKGLCKVKNITKIQNKQNTHCILHLKYQYSTGLELFWDDFPKPKKSEIWTHPPTSIINSDFLSFFLCEAPKRRIVSMFTGDQRALMDIERL